MRLAYIVFYIKLGIVKWIRVYFACVKSHEFRKTRLSFLNCDATKSGFRRELLSCFWIVDVYRARGTSVFYDLAVKNQSSKFLTYESWFQHKNPHKSLCSRLRCSHHTTCTFWVKSKFSWARVFSAICVSHKPRYLKGAKCRGAVIRFNKNSFFILTNCAVMNKRKSTWPAVRFIGILDVYRACG